MNKIFLFVIGFISILLVGLILFLKINETGTDFDALADHAEYKTIQDIRLISGVILPVQEVPLKAPMTGVLEKIYVKLGSNVKKGDPIAKIRLLANPNNVEVAQRAVVIAQSNYKIGKSNYDRFNILHDQKVITESEFEAEVNKWQLAQEELISAKKQLEIINTGYTKGQTNISNVVYSEISGIVLELPLKEGNSVVERNTFNDGTTVAVIADMKRMIFKGKVSESDIQYLRPGMLFTISLPALNSRHYLTRLSKIAPKGNSEETGTTKFDIEGNIDVSNDSLMLRSQFSAIAKIVLAERKNVLSIEEKYLHFNTNQTFIYLKQGDKKIKRYLKTGLSDGVNVQVLGGLTKKDNIALESDDL